MLRFGFTLLLTACGLDESGALETTDANVADVTSNDVVIADVVSEPGPPLACSTDATACVSGLETGWSPIAFEPTRVIGCPSNFTTADVVSDPQAQPGACACDCNVTTQPSCAIGSLTGTYGNMNQCGDGTNGPFTITTDGQCVSWGGSFGLVPYHDWNKLPLTPGTCTSSPTLDPNKVSLASGRVCIPSPQCVEDVCGGAVPDGFSACIVAQNDVACPAGPFSSKVGTVADAVTFACGACAGCSATGTGCGAATVDYYATSACTTSLAQDTVNGSCSFSANGVNNVGYIKYTGTVTSPSCTPGASTPAPSPTNLRTICCKP